MFFLVWGRDERVRFFAQQLLPEAFDFPNRNFSSLASWGFSLSRFWIHQDRSQGRRAALETCRYAGIAGVRDFYVVVAARA
jgi:hypothetical protein